ESELWKAHPPRTLQPCLHRRPSQAGQRPQHPYPSQGQDPRAHEGLVRHVQQGRRARHHVRCLLPPEADQPDTPAPFRPPEDGPHRRRPPKGGGGATDGPAA
ncbi:hypothetical protein BN1708_018069, partial [Verticillium longisporum]